jgi:pilus assembly protein CpaC
LGVDASMQLSGSSGEKGTYSYTVGGSISAKINALVGAGNGKILAQPHIVTKSGGTGRFHSGGQTYFKVSGVNSGSLQPVEYGVILGVKPVLRGKDNIMNEVTIEVSVPSSQPSGDFSLDKFDTTSTTLCKQGDSIIISGLAQTLQNYFKEKTPLLGSIPMLSLFFSESSKKTDKKELVVILTPHAVFPEASKQAPMSQERKKVLDQKDQ